MHQWTRWRRRMMAAFATAWTAGGFAATLSSQMVYSGMCDASGGVALDADHFVVACDEDSVIRLYGADRGGLPLQSFDLTAFLTVDAKKPETDLEATCWLGDKVYWISSHSRNRNGKFRLNRDCFFATSFKKTAHGYQCVPEGKAYSHLLEDFLAEPRLKRFKLEAGSQRAPKSPGAIDIEGLCGTPEGHLLIGFRNPIPRDRALLVPLLNPLEVIAGARAKLGEPVLLDLDGRGVRDIARWKNGYLIAAGPYNGKDDFALYTWAGGKAQPKRIKHIKLKDFHAEGIIVFPGRERSFELLSDDGSREVDGVPGKALPNPNQRHFRGMWVTLADKDAALLGDKPDTAPEKSAR